MTLLVTLFIIVCLNIIFTGFFIPDWKWYYNISISLNIFVFVSLIKLLDPTTTLLQLVLMPALLVLVGYLLRVLLDTKL